MKNPVLTNILAVWLFLIGLSAVFGAYGLIFKNGLGMPVAALSGSPFTSYFIPGLILGVVVGGTHLVASQLLFLRHRFSLGASAVAGFGLLIWIFTELYIIEKAHFLQALYFGFATVTLIAVMILLSLRKK